MVKANDTPPSKLLHSHTKGPLATVHIGSGDIRETHHLHKNLLQERSKYFGGAFKGLFIESASNEVSLPEDHPEGFRCFVDWLYAGRLTGDYGHTTLVHGWIMADKLMCQDLQNQIIDKLQLVTGANGVTTTCFEIASDQDAENTKLMDYLLTFGAWDCARHWEDCQPFLEEFFSSLNAQVVFRMVTKIHEYDLDKKAVDPNKIDSCKWHEHEPGFEGSCNPAPNKKRRTG